MIEKLMIIDVIVIDDDNDWKIIMIENNNDNESRDNNKNDGNKNDENKNDENSVC